MGEFLTFLSDHLTGRAHFLVVAVIGCVLIVPPIVKIWDSWKDFRSGKGELTVKKMQLEVLKLRYEVEIMKDKLARPLDADSKSLPTPSSIESVIGPQSAPLPTIPHTKQWAWLRRLAAYNRSGAIALLKLLRILAWLALITFGGFLAATLYYIEAPPPGLTASGAASTLILFLPGTLACYLAVHRLKIQMRVLLVTTDLKPEAAGVDRDN
jgi:hypothetical protein